MAPIYRSSVDVGFGHDKTLRNNLGPFFDLVNTTYGDGNAAVQRQEDGTGFGFYPGGRKAICVNAHNKSRRFSCVIFDDDARAPALGCLNEWGMGMVEAAAGPSGGKAPSYYAVDEHTVKIAKDGKVVSFDRTNKKQASAAASLAVAKGVTLRYDFGRQLTIVEFRSDGKSHDFEIGVVGPDVGRGNNDTIRRTVPQKVLDNVAIGSLGDLKRAKDSMKTIDHGLTHLRSTCSTHVGSVKSSLDALDFTQVLSNLNASLKGRISFDFERDLKLKVEEKNPYLNRGTINKWSGSYNQAKRYLNETACAISPPISLESKTHAELLDIIEHESGPVLIVAVAVAHWAAQSAHAMRLAQHAAAEFRGVENIRMITVDLSEQGSVISEMGYHSDLVKKYKIRAAPWLLITCQGSVLHNEKMGGFVHRLRYPTLARPRVLLVEPQFCHQMKTEQVIRLSGLGYDLALSISDAMKMAFSNRPYGILIASTDLAPQQVNELWEVVSRKKKDALFYLCHDNKDGIPSRDMIKLGKDRANFVFSRPVGKSAFEQQIGKHQQSKPSYDMAGMTHELFVNLLKSKASAAGINLAAA